MFVTDNSIRLKLSQEPVLQLARVSLKRSAILLARCTDDVLCLLQQYDKVKCPECNLVWYCNAECQRKHAQIHKGACRRAKLRHKLAAKPNGK